MSLMSSGSLSFAKLMMSSAPAKSAGNADVRPKTHSFNQHCPMQSPICFRSAFFLHQMQSPVSMSIMLTTFTKLFFFVDLCIDFTLGRLRSQWVNIYYFLPLLLFFQEFIVKLDDESATVTNYTGGEAAGSSWTDKVMSFKVQQETPQEEEDEAGDDEWVG